MQYMQKTRTERYQGFFLRDRDSGSIAGVFELSEITRGILQSAYLGFYAMAPHAGSGYMREGMQVVLRHVFRDLKLHRVEANIQPGNKRSIALVKRCGFRKEGYSPRYLKIGGRWRDHQRWALLAEDYRSAASRAR
jgi:ribosomal-protein-alanine N-acetyltransferase